MQQTMLETARGRFLEAVCQPNAFMGLLETTWQMLGWPILVGDNATNVIALIPEKPIGSLSYDRLLSEKRVSPHLYVSFQEVMKKVYNPEDMEVQYIPGEDERYPTQVFLTIRAWSVIVAHIVLHVPKEEVTKEEKEVITLLQKVLCAEARKSHQRGSLSEKITHYQMRALLEKPSGAGSREEYAEGLRKSLRGSYRIIVSLLEEEERQEAFPAFYVEEFSRLVPETISIAIGENVVTLCGELTPGREKNLSKLYEFARHCSVRIGVTRMFPSEELGQLDMMYQQALLTVRLGMKIEPSQYIYTFEELTPLQVFVPALREFQMTTFLDPVTKKIIDYDEQNNTEYLKTLRTYLVSGRNNKESIRLLAIHQNTLLYRLGKMKELFNIDFSDGKQTLTLLCNVLLLEVARPDLLPLLSIAADSE